ncbi:MAG: hypothetical protein ACYTHJ_07460 [Planctomycetota bacterium]|jgi:uncharacterized protein YhbP (UPF0306 family)
MTTTTASAPLRLIQTQMTLVLATADPEPWSASVYYVYQQPSFFFFSSADSRHVCGALACNRCAASIFRDGDDWRDIEGLQMDGTLERIQLGSQAVSVFRAYLEKFPSVKKSFLELTLDLTRFTEHFRTKLYAFVPEHVFYLNNQAGLDKRQEIRLPD